MTLDEAIKLIHSLQGETPAQLATPMQQALRLGIEALKFYQELKRTRGLTIAFRLPGETEEVKGE